MTPSQDPCATCGALAVLVTVQDERRGGSGVPVQRRTCTNADCPTNRPSDERLFTDKV